MDQINEYLFSISINRKMSYVIWNQKSDHYIHFNSKTGEYFWSNKLQGACKFSQRMGQRFLTDTRFDSSWTLKELDPVNRKDEPKIFDQAH